AADGTCLDSFPKRRDPPDLVVLLVPGGLFVVSDPRPLGTPFDRPSFASSSTPSLPSIPACPFTHHRLVIAFLCRRIAVAARNSLAYATPMYPLSSHFRRL
ncbi:hypothetical protein BT96DRAFT_606151, partial [Gymnopus androsaceus JB14]